MFTLAERSSILFMLVLIKAKADWFYRLRDKRLLSVYIANCVIVIWFDINENKL